MLIKEQVSAIVSPRPNSFAGLMELYELNYIQLQLLVGQIRALPDEQIAEVEGRVPVLLRVLECSRHTTTLMLTYCFTDTYGERETRPDTVVRVYHDALQVEVLSHRCRINKRTFQSTEGLESMLQCRWRMNRFLFKWLHYLRRKQYTFHLQI